MSVHPNISPYEACLELAAVQHGVIDHKQALAFGMNRHAIHRLVVTRKWMKVLPGVFRVAGVPDTWKQKIQAVWLWAGEGAAVSHRAAAILHGLPGIGTAPIEVTLPSSRRAPKPGLVIHRSVLTPADREAKDLLAVTTATRTIIDLGSVLTESNLEAALEDAIARSLTSPARINWRLSQSDMVSRRGTKRLRSLLAAHRSEQPPTESPLEVRFESILRRFGLPMPERQYEVKDGSRLVARLDFAYPSARLAFEVVGFEYHRGRTRFLRDTSRHNAVAKLGWDLRYITKEMIDEPRSLASEIAQELGLTLF
jgi:hypothetical protein